MKLRNARHSSNTLPTQLSELLSIGSIYIYESIHVSDDETLDVVGRLELPLCAKTVRTVSMLDLEGRGKRKRGKRKRGKRKWGKEGEREKEEEKWEKRTWLPNGRSGCYAI
jgi:hypothetical protein